MDTITSVSPVEFELIFVQGYPSLLTFFHYFVPGSLKIRTKHSLLRLDQPTSIEESDPWLSETKRWLLKGKELSFKGLGTRRWLPSGEMPYPGYCRAPGRGECIPRLCNCDKLYTIWLTMQKNQQQVPIAAPAQNGTIVKLKVRLPKIPTHIKVD